MASDKENWCLLIGLRLAHVGVLTDTLILMSIQSQPGCGSMYTWFKNH